MDHRNAPIGLFDSGVGGLSVYQEIRRMLPAEDVIYVADSAYCPYGTRQPDEIRARSEVIAGWLAAAGVKLVVAACNTASAMAIDHLRQHFPQLPFVGLEPAVKPAVAMSMTGRVGVLATPRTVIGDRLRVLIDHWAEDVEVRTIAGNGLVELVEAGTLHGEAVRRTLGPLLDPLLNERVDVIVLGCTHYPFLRSEIEAHAGDRVRVIDSGQAIARRTLSLLQANHLLHARGKVGSFRMVTTGSAVQTAQVSTMLLGAPVAVDHLDLQPGRDSAPE